MACISLFPAALCAQDDEEFDQYKLRIDKFWFYSRPSGSLQGSSDSGTVDLQKDLGFNIYSTFAGKIDWKFTRKNHLYVAFSPFYTFRQTTLTRTFVFQGHTFDAGLAANSELHAFLVAHGYQYDIIRRKRGHLGLAIQFDLFNTSAIISATGQVDGIPKSVSASGSHKSSLILAREAPSNRESSVEADKAKRARSMGLSVLASRDKLRGLPQPAYWQE